MAKLFLLLLLVAAVLDSSFGAVCGNPAQYAGKSLCDPWGGYCGECVSYYKVTNELLGPGSGEANKLAPGLELQALDSLSHVLNCLSNIVTTFDKM
ncbi:hypothetical protein OUZ56_016729 [Daphnia magna]|uniref:Uncharacterized protein n=1 Tax=Daphnia magna TaxID=35525 RepID=A0ABR0ARD9_9CRUS|nr:hypothetical protein OUZ56_016729 [Daphnia magna]